MDFKPCNRHLLLEPLVLEEAESESTILLPEEYRSKELHILATVVAAADDCKEVFKTQVGSTILCTSNMIEEVRIGGKAYYLLLENYVLCLVS